MMYGTPPTAAVTSPAAAAMQANFTYTELSFLCCTAAISAASNAFIVFPHFLPDWLFEDKQAKVLCVLSYIIYNRLGLANCDIKI